MHFKVLIKFFYGGSFKPSNQIQRKRFATAQIFSNYL